MKKQYKVVHSKDSRDPFPLKDSQVQREYNNFRLWVKNLFINPSIKAHCEKSVNCALFTLEGTVSEAELDLAAEQFLVLVNNAKVDGRNEQSNFIYIK